MAVNTFSSKVVNLSRSIFGFGSTSPNLPKSVKLSSGYDFPLLGLGTWQSDKPGEAKRAVEIALANGYRHVDCAWVYENQKEIGEALNKMFESQQLKREDVFITSKIWNTHHEFNQAKRKTDEILAELQLKYIDLMLMHFPVALRDSEEPLPMEADGKSLAFSDVDYLDTWKALEEGVKEGKIRSIGVANFNHKQLQRVLDNSTVKPSVLQIEMHPYLPQKKLREFCKANNIAVTAFSSLGNPNSKQFRKSGDPNILVDPVVKEIANTHNKTAAQILLRWAIQQNVHVIPKSSNEERIKQNADLFSFTLAEEDMNRLNKLDRNWRLVDFFHGHPHYPFNEEY